MEKHWEKMGDGYTQGAVYRAGIKHTIVGNVFQGMGNKAEPDAPLWVSKVQLPGIKQAPERFMTEEQAKSDVETRVKIWFKWMGVSNG